MVNCFFCDSVLKFDPEFGRFGNTFLHSDGFDCNRCGEYFCIYPDIVREEITPDDKIKIAAYLQEQRLNKYDDRIVIADDDKVKSAVLNHTRLPQSKPIPVVTIKEILDQFPKRVDEKLNRALQNLGKLSKERIGTLITVSFKEHAILYALDKTELTGILDALKDNGYIKYSKDIDTAYIIEVTAKGFDRIYELDKVNPTSYQGFVAMWFDSSMENAYKNGFKKAITDAGYKPHRIDKEEFLGNIDGKIIAEIRKSRFLVADFTDFRSGVFYESGFAKGLGIDVIFTCREDQKDKIKEHFDTRQEKHILWKDEADLYKQLLNSITANIGWGPQAKKEEPK